MRRYDICLLQFIVELRGTDWSIDIIADVLGEKSCIFLRMFVLISDFWEAFLGSNFSINFLISSVLVSLNLKVLDLFLVLINLILGWFWYFLMILETGFPSDESKLSYYWFLGMFLIGIFMKYSLNVFAIRWSWEITLSSRPS